MVVNSRKRNVHVWLKTVTYFCQKVSAAPIAIIASKSYRQTAGNNTLGLRHEIGAIRMPVMLSVPRKRILCHVSGIERQQQLHVIISVPRRKHTLVAEG